MTTTLAILLAALSQIESGGNDHAVGRAGEVSRYQIKREFWNHWTKSRVYHDEGVATSVATRELNSRLTEFRRATRREPSPFEVYALWNAPGQFERRGYDPSKLSPVVRERCRRFENIVTRIVAQREAAVAAQIARSSPPVPRVNKSSTTLPPLTLGLASAAPPASWSR